LLEDIYDFFKLLLLLPIFSEPLLASELTSPKVNVRIKKYENSISMPHLCSESFIFSQCQNERARYRRKNKIKLNIIEDLSSSDINDHRMIEDFILEPHRDYCLRQDLVDFTRFSETKSIEKKVKKLKKSLNLNDIIFSLEYEQSPEDDIYVSAKIYLINKYGEKYNYWFVNNAKSRYIKTTARCKYSSNLTKLIESKLDKKIEYIEKSRRGGSILQNVLELGKSIFQGEEITKEEQIKQDNIELFNKLS
jgi:hypothetical protein